MSYIRGEALLKEIKEFVDEDRRDSSFSEEVVHVINGGYRRDMGEKLICFQAGGGGQS